MRNGLLRFLFERFASGIGLGGIRAEPDMRGGQAQRSDHGARVLRRRAKNRVARVARAARKRNRQPALLRKFKRQRARWLESHA